MTGSIIRRALDVARHEGAISTEEWATAHAWLDEGATDDTQAASATIAWDDARSRPVPLTRPMIVTGAYLTRCIRGGVAFEPHTLGITSEQLAAIADGRAEITGDSDEGFVYLEEQD